MKRRLVSLWCMLLICLPQIFASNSYGLASNCQDGVILHCFNWKYSDIKAELPNIAKAGFTSVQTSPAQGNGSGTWYWLYQPYDLAVGTNGLGSRSDLKALCDEAEKYGIKIIVDVVANHLNGSMDYVESRWKNDAYWHDYEGGIDYNNRWQITHGKIGMRDLNSEHSYVQEQARKYVDDLYSLGVDGIRWDAAKHIGLPSEDCQFWPKVCRSDMFHYGEILVGPTDNGGDTEMKEYTNYMTVTDSSYGKTCRDSFSGGSAPSAHANWAARGINDNKIVYWAESHDTWANGYDWGYSHGMSQNTIDRAYAIVASRNGASALYFSRPSTSNKEDIKIGAKGSTAFTSAEVAAVNHFHNAMIGQKDYYVQENGNAAVCRQKGAVIVKGSGSGQVSISNGGSTTTPGTYKDEITGNTWTVTSSTISGQVGSSGIAVIYDYENAGHNGGDNGGNNGGNNDNTSTNDPVLNEGEYAAFFENNQGWGTVYAWVWDDSSNYTGGTWPGQACSNVGGNVWKWTASGSIPSGAKIIFSNGTGGTVGSDQTADLDWVNGGYYSISGLVKTITPSSGNENNGGNNNNNNNNNNNDNGGSTGTDDLKPGNTGDYTGDYVPSGKSLNTEYYKTNPNGKVGTNKTINMSFSNGVSSTALSNWTEAELIAQGVARDVAQAIKGKHERPIYDTYSLYAAYDDNYLYLGWQFVYLVWDLYGEGKQPGESKPHNGDIRQMIALDLDPNKNTEGILTNGNTIWDEDGVYNTFDNGADCFLLFSSKPTVGTPGIFLPDESGKYSYDSAHCLNFEANSYGYQDGLLPSITSLYGQESFEYDPSVLEGTTGFVDLIGEIDKSAHTFYEMKIPLSKLGITKDYIESTGIGVMHVATYGQGATGSIPYDDTVFDNVNQDYSKDPSSSAEKEDKDVFTYAMARIGKAASSDDTTTSPAPVVTATPGSGSRFVESVSVTLTVEPAGSKIYYTTDGSKPSSASNLYSSAITLTETTTLKTYVSDANGERVQTFNFTKGGGSSDNGGNNNNDDSDIVLNEGEYAAFFENTTGWSSVYAWVWDDTNNYSGGTWPGQQCTKITDNVWKWTASTAIPAGSKIIFSNGTGNVVGTDQTEDMDWVNGGYYTLSGYVKTIQPSTGGGNNNDDPVVSNDWVAHFKNTCNWGTVYAYVWDNAVSGKELLGAWPGTAISYDSAKGYYTANIPNAASLTTPMIIFNNGSGNVVGTDQTTDFNLVNWGIYDMTGLVGSGVDNVISQNEMKIYTSNGRLFIVSDNDSVVTIVSADGRMMQRNVYEGVNIIDDLSRGFYIVNRTKVVL